jgi:hypothetical protein
MPRTEKPRDLEAYKLWLLESHKIDASARCETYHNSVTSAALDQLETALWKQISSSFRDIGEQYLVNTGYDLFTLPAMPKLYAKTFMSALEKTFRKNVLDNKTWPDPPSKGWILPPEWFSDINDIMRTRFVVKYLDGVGYLTEQIGKICAENGHDCHSFTEAREQGYYAAHLYITRTYEVPKLTWDTYQTDMGFEIQITTQLQETIQRLLQQYYETARIADRPTGKVKWQWNYRSDEFVANYLGHMLHYVEGMIMEVRERQRGAV